VISILARKSLLILLNNVIGGVLGFITLAIIARELGADDLGVLGFGLSFLGMFTFIANLGFDSAHNKRVSEGEDLGSCMGAYVTIKIILTLIMTAVALFVIVIYSYFFDGFSSSDEEAVVFILLAYYILWSLSLIPITTFNSQRKQAKAQIPSIVEFLVRAPLIIFLVLSGFGIVYVALSYVAGAVVLSGLGLIFLRGYPISRPDVRILRKYGNFALPMSIIAMITTMYLYVDKVMIGFFLNTEEVGYYYGAQRIIMFVVVSAAAVAILLFPTISSHHAKGEISAINQLISSSERYLSMLIFPVVCLVIALRDPIVELILGDGFKDSGLILAFLSMYALLAILNKPYSQVLTGMGRTRLAVTITGFIFLVNFLLNLMLIPEDLFGMTLIGLGGAGAALATVIADSGRFVLVRRETRHLIGRTFDPLTHGKHLVASAIAAMAIFGANLLVSSDILVYLVIPELFIGLGIYLLILVAMREFTRDDYDFFMEMIHPVKMGGYMLSEIKEKGHKEN